MGSKLWPTLLLSFIGTALIAQDNGEMGTRKTLRKNSSHFLNIGMGTGYSTFRDFATSPLVYSGLPFHASISFSKIHEKRESNFGVNFQGGRFSNSFNNHSKGATALSADFSYSLLHEIPRLNNNKWNFKYGALASSWFSYRSNPSLQNNAYGYEIIPTIFLSAQVKRKFVRTEIKRVKLLFIKYNLQPRERDLSFRLNFGLINSSIRNGYAYSGQSSVINDFSLFDRYRFNAFTGLRMSSRLNYTIHLNNKNRIQFSYVWDAFNTNDDLDSLEMATHQLRFTFMFNTNNK